MRCSTQLARGFGRCRSRPSASRPRSGCAREDLQLRTASKMEVPVRTVLSIAVVIAFAAGAYGQQAPGSDSSAKSGGTSTPQKSDKADKTDKAEKPDKGDKVSTKIGSLVGCVEQSAPNRFTLLDPQNGKYQLSGSGLG